MKMIQRQRQTQVLHRLCCHPSKSPNSEILDKYSCTTADCSRADCPLFLNLESLTHSGGEYNWDCADLEEVLLEYLISQTSCAVNTIFLAHIY